MDRPQLEMAGTSPLELGQPPAVWNNPSLPASNASASLLTEEGKANFKWENEALAATSAATVSESPRDGWVFESVSCRRRIYETNETTDVVVAPQTAAGRHRELGGAGRNRCLGLHQLRGHQSRARRYDHDFDQQHDIHDHNLHDHDFDQHDLDHQHDIHDDRADHDHNNYNVTHHDFDDDNGADHHDDGTNHDNVDDNNGADDDNGADDHGFDLFHLIDQHLDHEFEHVDHEFDDRSAADGRGCHHFPARSDPNDCSARSIGAG